MGWQVNNGYDAMASFYPASQFRKTFYRPDVMKLLLKEGNLHEALAAAGNSRGLESSRTEVALILPPKVSITSPAGGRVESGGAPVRVEAVARSVGGNRITAMRVLLDGRRGSPPRSRPSRHPFSARRVGRGRLQFPPGATA